MDYGQQATDRTTIDQVEEKQRRSSQSAVIDGSAVIIPDNRRAPRKHNYSRKLVLHKYQGITNLTVHVFCVNYRVITMNCFLSLTSANVYKATFIVTIKVGPLYHTVLCSKYLSKYIEMYCLKFYFIQNVYFFGQFW